MTHNVTRWRGQPVRTFTYEGTPEYRAWKGIRSRCYNPKNAEYRRNGARGIATCDRWRDSYEAFLADMGTRPSPAHSLRRLDTNGDYEPSNCRWLTAQEHPQTRATTHGETRHRCYSAEYRAWKNMKNRCLYPSAPYYEIYGGRGITICERWLHSYETFLADMGRRPGPCYSLDRIDTDGGYEPSNCRWATAAEQSKNRRPRRTIQTPEGLFALTELAARLGLKVPTLKYRLRHMPIERVLREPLRQRRSA